MSTCCCIGQVDQAEVAVIERCGKFYRMQSAGLLCLCFPFDLVATRISLQSRVFDCHMETKTADNVFVTVHMSINYSAIGFDKKQDGDLYKATYLLFDYVSLMTAYVKDTVRQEMCKLTLDRAYESKSSLQNAVQSRLSTVMQNYGYSISTCQVTDLKADRVVEDAMNQINNQKIYLEAQKQKAEADKLTMITQAQGQMEAMKLSGIGVAKQRKAIMEGLRESIADFKEASIPKDAHGNQIGSSTPRTTAKDVMDLLILNQYFDTLQDIGSNPQTRCVFTSSENQPVRTGMMQAQAGGM